MKAPIYPIPPRPSQYGVEIAEVTKRMYQLPDIVSLTLEELFPDMPSVVFPSTEGIQTVRRAAKQALAGVNLSFIQPNHSVNICASHHGFTILGGEPYAELLRAVREEIAERTGCENIRLRAGVGLRFRETEEYIKRHKLDEYYKGKARGVAPIDEGIPIETEIGTLYGLKAIYDADWIVHVHNSDVREVHFHRQVDRSVKPFGMSYARIETRSTYHQNLGPRGANFTARAIFDSEFVRSKFAFTAFLNMSPNGVVSVVASNDLYEVNDHLISEGLKYYGKIMTLMGRIDECIVGLDFPCPVPYVFAAGVIYANFLGTHVDLFDLDNSLAPYTWYTEAFYGKNGKPLIEGVEPVNPAIKMVVHNYAWIGYPSAFFSEQIPTIVVGRKQADLFNQDPQNMTYMKYAAIADDLDSAMHLAHRLTKTDKLLIFDGAVGGLNVSRSLAEELFSKAPQVSKEVDSIYLPKWFKQRGLKL